jgi:alkylresorcinol/alkylpyrone synthase
MKKNNLIHVETLVPEYNYSEAEMLSACVEWVERTKDKNIIEKSINIFKNTKIKKKNSILPSKEVIFSNRSFDESNALYRKEAVRYAIEIVKNTLEKTNTKPEEIDFLVSTSCTGLMSPSINAHLINEFRMRNDVVHIPVAQVGCSGGTSGLIYVNHLLSSKPNSKALMLNLEFNSNTLQYNNYNLDNIIGTAIFADGIACSLFENSEKNQLLKIVDVFSHHFYDTENILRYDLGTTGFTLKMSKELPVFVAKNYLKTANHFLSKHHLSIKDMDHILVHPGGIRILESVEKIISEFGKNLNSSKIVMEQHGNMSSATIMFILHHVVSGKIKKDEKILMASFGPGFAANFILFEVS